MNKLYTVGFTKKSAEFFFSTLSTNGITVLVDIRLNNTSQLASFAKYPDIKFFLKQICNIEYVHDRKFAPTEAILKLYKNKNINWIEYSSQFDRLMNNRDIKEHIIHEYNNYDKICLLCSEDKYQQCHRSLVANYFKSVFESLEIIHL